MRAPTIELLQRLAEIMTRSQARKRDDTRPENANKRLGNARSSARQLTA